MRILVVNHRDISNPQSGGLEEIVHETAKRWRAWGHTVDVLCTQFRGAPKTESINGVHYIRGSNEYLFHWWAPWKVTRLGARHYDIILEYASKVPCFLPLFIRSTPIAVMIPHLFGKTIFEELSWPLAFLWFQLEMLIPSVYRHCNIWVNSQSTAADLLKRGIKKDRITVIYAGIADALHVSESHVIQTPFPSLVYIGRLKEYKHVDLIIKAAALLKKHFPTLQLRIVGHGSALDDLQLLSRSLQLHNTVSFYGYVSEKEKKKVLMESWIGVQTSSNEGWGLAVTEAGACGIPTVASNSPGLRESVQDGETGFVVPHGDVDALVEKIRLLLTDAPLRERMGKSARVFASRFTWDETAKHALEFIQRNAGPTTAHAPSHYTESNRATADVSPTCVSPSDERSGNIPSASA